MKKLRVMTVVGTRPEIIRLSRVMAALDRTMDHVIVHTGQNYDYELNGIFFEDLELRKPDHFLEAAGGTAAETIGQVIARADAVMRQVRPDVLLVLGDTNSCLSAIAAKRIDASTSEFRKRSIAGSSITSATSTSLTALSLVSTYCGKASLRSA